jgi:peroxiredoxin
MAHLLKTTRKIGPGWNILCLLRKEDGFVRATITAIVFCLFLASAQWARGDNATEKLLADSGVATRSLHALTAQIDLTWQTPALGLKKNVGSVRLMKPNYVLMTLTGDYPLITLASDGRSVYMLSDPTKYTIANAEPHGKNIDTPWWALPVRFFFTQSVKPFGPDSPQWTSSRYIGFENIAGERCSVVEISGEQPMAYVARLYFDSRKLLRRSVVTFGPGPGAPVFTAEIRNVRTARRWQLNEFRFRPPATAKLDTGAEAKMLAIGETGPDFTLPTPEGGALTFSNLRRGKKATLINFWYLACPPCREEFKLFQKLYTDLKEQGFSVIAINKVDEAEDIRDYIRKYAITFPIVMGEPDEPGVLGSYHIETYPSSYLLDSEGKIVYRFVGMNEAGLLEALRKLGFQK